MRLTRFQVHNSVLHHQYIALCVHPHVSNLLSAKLSCTSPRTVNFLLYHLHSSTRLTTARKTCLGVHLITSYHGCFLPPMIVNSAAGTTLVHHRVCLFSGHQGEIAGSRGCLFFKSIEALATLPPEVVPAHTPLALYWGAVSSQRHPHWWLSSS